MLIVFTQLPDNSMQQALLEEVAESACARQQRLNVKHLSIHCEWFLPNQYVILLTPLYDNARISIAACVVCTGAAKGGWS